MCGKDFKGKKENARLTRIGIGLGMSGNILGGIFQL